MSKRVPFYAKFKLWENYTEISSHFRCSCLNGDNFSVVKKINGTPVSSTNKTDSHDITEIVMKEALNTMILYCILQMFSDIFISFLLLFSSELCYSFSIIIKLQSHKLTFDIVQRLFHSSVSNTNVAQNIFGRLGVCSPREAEDHRFNPRSVKPKTIHTYIHFVY